MYLVVYRCYDNQEEEACFLVNDVKEAKAFLDRAPKPPEGYEDRAGYYFFEKYAEIANTNDIVYLDG